MKPIASIVCGVDHSSGARAAVRFAAELADRLTSRLVLVHAVSPPLPQRELGTSAGMADANLLDALRRAGASLLEEVEQELGPDRQVVTELAVGEASHVIAGSAEQVEAALVVVGSRGLGSVGALVLGSVSLRLAVHGPCPTVVVPESGGTIAGGPILCAVDDGEASRAAAALAATLAERLEAELLLVHAEPDDTRAPQGQELLAQLAVETGIGASVKRIVVRGKPAEAIIEAATAHGVELIVIGSRGRGALASAALGSVSASVATRAPCPVTVVRDERPAAAER